MQRPLGQKIALGFAIFSYIGAAVCALAAIFYGSEAKSGDPVVASFMAAVVFFIGCGVVLQVIGTARLKGLLSGSDQDLPKD